MGHLITKQPILQASQASLAIIVFYNDSAKSLNQKHK